MPIAAFSLSRFFFIYSCLHFISFSHNPKTALNLQNNNKTKNPFPRGSCEIKKKPIYNEKERTIMSGWHSEQPSDVPMLALFLIVVALYSFTLLLLLFMILFCRVYFIFIYFFFVFIRYFVLFSNCLTFERVFVSLRYSMSPLAWLICNKLYIHTLSTRAYIYITGFCVSISVRKLFHL